MPEDIFGVIKPKGPTSHDIVGILRRVTGEQTVGHAGTLDPLAEGVLVVGVGRAATKRLHEVVATEKEYVAKVYLGLESSTDDEEGEKTKTFGRLDEPTREEIDFALKRFMGKIEQVPPAYSAIKVKGQSAYRSARKGKPLDLAPRPVLIKEIEIMEYTWPVVTLRVVTGPGVYIRALARDLGRALGTGGYLTGLERTRVGDFTKEKCLTLPQVEKKYSRMRA